MGRLSGNETSPLVFRAHVLHVCVLCWEVYRLFDALLPDMMLPPAHARLITLQRGRQRSKRKVCYKSGKSQCRTEVSGVVPALLPRDVPQEEGGAVPKQVCPGPAARLFQRLMRPPGTHVTP